MAKPILIIRSTRPEDSDHQKIIELIRKSVDDEYHVLLVFDHDATIRFETYNADNLNPIDIEKLKEVVNGTRK